MKKIHKIWIERELKKGYKKEDLEESVRFFESNKVKFDEKDIMRWDGKALEDKIKEGVVSNREIRKNNRGNYKVIHDDDDFILVRLDDKEASQFWGVGTKWCISMESANYFNSYSSSNVVFYVLTDKKKENKHKHSKVCVVLYRDTKNNVSKEEYYLSDDTCVTKSKLPKRVRDFLDS